MCNAPKEFFIPSWDVKRISRSKLHKYLLRRKSDEKIFNEISNGQACIYQQTILSGYSSLFLAISKRNENVVKKVMEIYENDYKILKENGYNNESAVLIAFGSDEIKFIEDKLSKFSTENDDEGKKKFMILMKETNESPARVRIVSPKNNEEQNQYLEIVAKLYDNGTFDVNFLNMNGTTLFLVAASQGYIWVLEKLMEMGAQHDITSREQTSPFEFACINQHMETVKWFHKKFSPDLLKFMTEGNSLFKIAAEGSFEAFDFIMSEIKRFDGDEHVQEIFTRKTDYHDCNILMQAVNSSQFDFAIKCLKYEPDLNVTDSSKNNLLHVILRSYPSDKELINILIKKQPELLLMEDSNQWTPLHLLANRNFIDKLKSVYQKFPSYKNSFFKNFCDTPTAQKEKDKVWCATPGHAALSDVIGEGFLEMAEFIIDNHFDEFESSEFISGLLVVLAQKTDSVSFIKKLQKLKHFDINVPDATNKFPLNFALANKRIEMFKYMMESCKIKDLNVMVESCSKANILYHAIWKNPVSLNAVPYNTFECGTVTHDIDSSEDEAERNQEASAPPYTLVTHEVPAEIERKTMFEVFKNLINCGANFGHKMGKLSLLHTAVDNDNLEVVEELLKLGLTADEVGDNGETPLHYVKSVEVFTALMAKVDKPEVIEIKNAQGRTAFMCFVALFGYGEVQAELFDEFMKHKANVKAADNDGYQPIHAANTIEWVKTLLQNGADVNATNNEGENAAHIALRAHNWNLAKFLLHKTAIDRYAVSTNGASYISYITMGNVNYHEIFYGELKKVFDELVEKNINEQSLFGGLLINVFIQEGDLKMIQHPKANLHLKEPDGQTCLHRAIAFKTNLEVVKVLVDRGLDVNAVNESRITPLMLCLEYHCSDVAAFLIKQEKVDLNLTDVYGFSALHYAARTDDISVMCRLLAAGADPSINNNENKTFFDMLAAFDKKLFSFYETKH
jgi:uncharacterized protein